MTDTATRPESSRGDSLRAGLYSLLAAMLAGPPSDFILTRLRGIADVSKALDPMAMAWWGIKRAADSADPFELEEEHQVLFVGLGRGELVPYGSWYQTGRIMSEPLATLRTDLAELGVCRQMGVFEPEDHAAPLCETMALLCGRPESVSHEAQQRFFDRHVAGWMPQFFRDLQQAPSARFYRAVGALGEAFMALEMQYFSL